MGGGGGGGGGTYKDSETQRESTQSESEQEITETDRQIDRQTDRQTEIERAARLRSINAHIHAERGREEHSGQQAESPHLIILLGGHRAGGHIIFKVVQKLTGLCTQKWCSGRSAKCDRKGQGKKKTVRAKKPKRKYGSSSQMVLHLQF